MAWTEERVDLLKKLWTEGLSASQIARTMGDVTRNAVIGKVHRLGLSGRASSRPQRPRHVTMPKPLSKPVPIRPVILDEELTSAATAKNNVLNIAENMCKWPIGDPGSNEFRFCGKKSKAGSPYCEGHACMAYQQGSTKRSKAERRAS